MKTKIITSLLLFSCINIIWAKTLAGLQKSANGYTLDLDIPQWQVEAVDTFGLVNRAGYAGENFARIQVPGYTYIYDIGKPQLPIFTFYMAITSPDQVPGFEVLRSVEESVTLKDRYFPAQAPWLKSQSILDRRFEIDDAYYNSPGERQALANVDEVFSIRGVPCAKVKISPFSYNPIENKITVVKKFTLRINTPTTPKYQGLDSKTFENFLRYIMVNFDHAVEPVRDRDREEDYLIITAPQFEPYLIDFVAFRERHLDVTVVTTYQTGASTFEIEEYIKNLNPTPAFILLVGDVEDVPSRDNPASDLYYSIIDSSYYPDIFLGRFSVSSTTELANIIYKTIYMENNLHTFAPKNLFVGGVDGVYGDIAEQTHDYCIDTHFEPAGYINIKRYVNSDPTVTKDSVLFDINNGVIFNIYSGHGVNTSWAVGPWALTNSDVEALQNTVYSFTYGFACYTGTYTEDNCFTEALTRAEHGAVIAVGASVSSSWVPDMELQEGMADAMFNDTNPQTSIAASLNAGKMSVNNSQQRYFEMYNLMGDPALEVFPINSDPYISVYSPNGGEEWELITTQIIRWNDNIDGNVKIELLKGGSLKETLAGLTESDGKFEWSIPGNFQTGSDYAIKITSIDSAQLFDESDSNFSVVEEYIIDEFPYVEDFDALDTPSTTLPKKWEQVTGDDFDWIVLAGPTPSKVGVPSNKTGPSGDHTSDSGNYIYVEASTPNYPDKRADFITAKFNYKSLVKPELTFWCHMFSDTNAMGDLYLDINVDSTWYDSVVHLTGDHGDKWFSQTLDLSGYKGDRVVFRFRAVTGSLWAGDIAIDDIRIEGETAVDNIIVKPHLPFSLKYYGSRIYFQIPRSGNNKLHLVKIGIYNTQGRLVKTLLNKRVKPGKHTIHPDITGTNRYALAAGLYLCRMETEEFNKTINILLRK